MILHTYWLAQRISETASWPPRVAAILFVAGTMGVVGWIAKRERGTRCAWAAMALFVPMASFPFLGCIPANTERFMNFPMMAALALPLHGRGWARPWAWAAAGACAALALLYKPICLPVLAFAFAVWLVETFRAHGLRRAGLHVLAMAGGGGLAGAGALAFFAAMARWAICGRRPSFSTGRTPACPDGRWTSRCAGPGISCAFGLWRSCWPWSSRR